MRRPSKTGTTKAHGGRLTLARAEKVAKVLARVKRARGGKHPGSVRLMNEAEIRAVVERLRKLWSERHDHGAFYDSLILSAAASDRRLRAARKVAVPASPLDLIELPRWVVDECVDRVRAGLRTLATGKGRMARWIAGYKRDRIDYQRWDTVQALHEANRATWEEVFAIASLDLEGTFAAGSESAVRHSWRRVQRRGGGVGTYESYFLQLPLGPREV